MESLSGVFLFSFLFFFYLKFLFLYLAPGLDWLVQDLFLVMLG